MSILSVEIAEKTLEQITRLAAAENRPVEQVIEEALTRHVSATEQLEYLRARALRGRNVSLKALLDKVPKVPPLPGDELPDDLVDDARVKPARSDAD
jgi:hypothetical protein